MGKEITIYRTRNSKEPFTDWVNSQREGKLVAQIKAREDRIRHGNYGDHKHLHGIIELRLDIGKGYRIYCGEDGNTIVVLLLGGDKSSQDRDIKRAVAYWRDYNEQKEI